MAVPQNLVATVASDTSVQLSWDAFVGANSYDIQRNSVVVVYGHSGTTYLDTGLTSGVQYTYRVRAEYDPQVDEFSDLFEEFF